MFESDAHTETELDSGSERGSPSLVGRGIANPQEFLAYLEGQKKCNTR
jgi:hypothetical protein